MIERGSELTDNRPPIVSQIWSQSSRLSNSSHEFRVGGLFQKCEYAWRPKLQKHKWKPQLISEQLIAETVFQMWDPRRPDGVLNMFDGHIT